MEAASAPQTPPAPADDNDIDLTAPPAGSPPPPPPPSPEGGPNAPHPHDDEAALEEGTASPAAAPEPPAAGAPSEPTPETPPAPSAESARRTGDSPPPAPPSEPGSDAGTDPAAGGDPAAGKKSGSAKRDYTLLEEQQVVPLTTLSDAERKKHEGKAVTGYVEREGGPVEGRNADVVLEAIYPDEESVPEGVSGVLPVSERNWHPVELNFEPVQKSRLKLKRR